MKTSPKTYFLLAASTLLAFCPLAGRAQDAPPAAPPAQAAPTAQGVTLRYKFTPGQTHRYRMMMTMTGTMRNSPTGTGIPLNTKMTMTYSQTVKDVRATDGAATVVGQMDEMQMTMNGKTVSMPEAQSAQMKKPYTILMLPTGKVLSMEMPQMPTGAVPGMDFSKSFSMNAAFPDAPVKTGDNWNGTVDMGAAMVGLKMAVASTLVDVKTVGKNDQATINQDITGNLDMTLSKNMPMTMKMQGKITGTAVQVFDVTAGMVQSQIGHTTTNLTMMFKPTPGQAAPPGMPPTMTMQMNQDTQVTLLDSPAAAKTASAR